MERQSQRLLWQPGVGFELPKDLPPLPGWWQVAAAAARSSSWCSDIQRAGMCEAASGCLYLRLLNHFLPSCCCVFLINSVKQMGQGNTG